MQRRRQQRRYPLGLLSLVALLCATCGRSANSGPAEQNSRLSVILIVVDALRADHLGCYGYPLNTTPVIDALAEHALVAPRMFSQSNWTGASMASIMTGTYPAVHKIIKSPEDGLDRFSVLPKELVIIPEVLQRSGYFTAAVTSCGWVSPTSGFGRGFVDFHLVERNDEVILRKTLDVLGSHEAPFFLYLHFLDAHDYFDLNQEYRPFSGRRFTLSNTMRKLAKQPRADIFGWLGSPTKKERLTRQDVAYLEDRYDSLVNRTDQIVGRLVEFLRETGALEKTLVILSADHGENFSEHGRFTHNGDSVYNETLHIPLIIHNRRLFPEQKRVERLAESLDIFPTILDLLGIEDATLSRTRQLQGHSLLADVDEKTVWSESGSHDKMKILVGKWSLVADRRTGRTELYDVETDPRETRDLAREHPEIVGRLKVVLGRKAGESQALGQRILPQDALIDPETKRVLESLGYIR